MTKEQYLSIVASWKKFIKEGKHKKYKVYYSAWILNGDGSYYGRIVKDYGYRWESNLWNIHHFIYALIRKKDYLKAFKNNETLFDLMSHVKYLARKETKKPEEFWEPFGKEFTPELLQEVVQKLD